MFHHILSVVPVAAVTLSKNLVILVKLRRYGTDLTRDRSKRSLTRWSGQRQDWRSSTPAMRCGARIGRGVGTTNWNHFHGPFSMKETITRDLGWQVPVCSDTYKWDRLLVAWMNPSLLNGEYLWCWNRTWNHAGWYFDWRCFEKWKLVLFPLKCTHNLPFDVLICIKTHIGKNILALQY